MKKLLESIITQELTNRILKAAEMEAAKVKAETGIKFNLTLYSCYSETQAKRYADFLRNSEDPFTRDGFIPASYVVYKSDVLGGLNGR